MGKREDYIDALAAQLKAWFVEKYIANQEEHHRQMSFKEEFVAFLKKHEIQYDEKYLWE